MAVVFEKPTLVQRLAPLFRGFDLPLLLLVLMLASAGLLAMYSSGYDHGTRFVDHGRNMLIAGYAQSWCGLLIIPLAFFFGADAVASLLNIIPDFVQTGMDVAAAFLPALGFAMLAQMIMNKTVAPFFFAGFFLVAYFGISTTGVAIFAAIIVVAMTVLGDKKKAEQPAVATEDPAIGSGFDEF